MVAGRASSSAPGDFVVVNRRRYSRREHLADLNLRPGPTIRRRHRPDAIGHGLGTPLIEEQVGPDVPGVMDWRVWYHHELRWGGEDEGWHT
jgi:hypothetical protein